jgi:hypothetical protein
MLVAVEVAEEMVHLVMVLVELVAVVVQALLAL